jgi:hypothetical protein
MWIHAGNDSAAKTVTQIGDFSLEHAAISELSETKTLMRGAENHRSEWAIHHGYDDAVALAALARWQIESMFEGISKTAMRRVAESQRYIIERSAFANLGKSNSHAPSPRISLKGETIVLFEVSASSSGLDAHLLEIAVENLALRLSINARE